MMKFAFIATLLLAGAVHAESLSGDAAKAKWEEILPASTLVENTTAVTTIKFKNVTCTLIGSHAGAAEARGGETYTCEIEN